ncbi:MAG TPA: hypothetical protein VHO48_05845 [Anaerolineaceae bacterium]|nr:hypothetical protein [Anaerolineaceae bacterium]
MFRQAWTKARVHAGVWLFLGAFVVRLAIAIPFINYPIALDDMLQYDMLARSLIAGNGYRWYSQADLQANRPYLEQVLDYSVIHVPREGVQTTFRPPGYPFFLAGLYAVLPFETRWVYTRIAQCVLGASLALIAVKLGMRLGVKRRAAWLAGGVVAFYPILQMYPIALASENLFIPLVGLSILAVYWSTENASLGRAAVAGGLLGLAILTRSVITPFSLVAGAWLARFSPLRWRAALIFLAAAFGVCLPWAVRNTLVSGRPAFIETSLSYQMYIGYHPEGDGGFETDIAIRPLKFVDDAQRDAHCRAAVIDFIKADPLGALGRVIKRGAFFFGAEDRELIYFYTNGFFGAIAQPWLTVIYLALVLPWMGLCGFAVLGWLISAHSRTAWLLVGFTLAYILPHLAIIAEPRFHLTLVPILAPLAAAGWFGRRDALARLLHAPRGFDLARWSALAALACLVVYWVWGFWLRWGALVAVLSPGGDALRQVY